MAVDVKVPKSGESISEVEIGEWMKSKGDPVEVDEILVVLETDKASMEVPAPVAGVVTGILKQTGEMAAIDEVIATIDETASAPSGGGSSPSKEAGSGAGSSSTGAAGDSSSEAGSSPAGDKLMPAAKRALAEAGLTADQVEATGPGGRLLKEDVQRAASGGARTAGPSAGASTGTSAAAPPTAGGSRGEEIVPMSRMRRRIAQRLVEAQQNAAILTTFNEIDMSAVMDLRQQFKQAYVDRYGVKLGFMSFFVKAAVDALKQFPQINAYVEDDSVVYHDYFDIGIAVGGGKGLVVPVLRNAECMSFAEIETTIGDFGKRARDNKITIDELTGGTFTISNGGVYGSMMSTPILNPPQSGILGLHAIEKRPVVVDDQIVIRPMMYVALSYDHRIVDGRESVTFLKRIKDTIENPARILLEI